MRLNKARNTMISHRERKLFVITAVLFVLGVFQQEAQAEDVGPKFHVKVCARFRPVSSNRRGNNPAGGQSVVLPLHQRLHLIRAQENCSLSEAQRILWEPRGGQSSPWSDSEVKTPQKKGADGPPESPVKGAASPSGFKALEGDEKVQACVVNMKPGERGSVLMCCPAQGLREFSLDYVMDETSSQEEAYNAVAAEQVDHFLAGNDVCLFAYGQTGSGKTHTMFGPDEIGDAGEGQTVEASQGIVQKVCRGVLARLREGDDGGEGGRLSVAMVEVFGETVVDLLVGGAREGDEGGAGATVGSREVLGGRRHVGVRDEGELAALLSAGCSRRRRAATAVAAALVRVH